MNNFPPDSLLEPISIELRKKVHQYCLEHRQFIDLVTRHEEKNNEDLEALLKRGFPLNPLDYFGLDTTHDLGGPLVYWLDTVVSPIKEHLLNNISSMSPGLLKLLSRHLKEKVDNHEFSKQDWPISYKDFFIASCTDVQEAKDFIELYFSQKGQNPLYSPLTSGLMYNRDDKIFDELFTFILTTQVDNRKWHVHAQYLLEKPLYFCDNKEVSLNIDSWKKVFDSFHLNILDARTKSHLYYNKQDNIMHWLANMVLPHADLLHDNDKLAHRLVQHLMPSYASIHTSEKLHTSVSFMLLDLTCHKYKEEFLNKRVEEYYSQKLEKQLLYALQDFSPTELKDFLSYKGIMLDKMPHIKHHLEYVELSQKLPSNTATIKKGKI